MKHIWKLIAVWNIDINNTGVDGFICENCGLGRHSSFRLDDPTIKQSGSDNHYDFNTYSYTYYESCNDYLLESVML